MEDFERGHVAGARIHNTFDCPIRIVSGEVEALNNKIIPPGHGFAFTITVPDGYRNYSKQYWGLNKEPTIYIGWVLDEAGDDNNIEIYKL